MNQLKYWVTMEKLTSERIGELEKRLATGIRSKSIEWFTSRTLASNKSWNDMAKIKIAKLKAMSEAAAIRLEDMSKRTFRGNDDT